MTIMNLELGIISGDQKRVLECYLDLGSIRQRKSYDEYYVDVDIITFNYGINDLMILAEEFDVKITSNSIYLSDK